MTVELVIGLAIGFGAGVLVMYGIAVRPLVNALMRLRYDGFRPTELPPRPKTIAPQERHVRED